MIKFHMLKDSIQSFNQDFIMTNVNEFLKMEEAFGLKLTQREVLIVRLEISANHTVELKLYY